MTPRDELVRTFIAFQMAAPLCNPHQQRMRVPVAPHSHQHLVLSMFQILAVPVGAQWGLTIALIRISLMTYDLEHLFINSYLFACLFNLFCCKQTGQQYPKAVPFFRYSYREKTGLRRLQSCLKVAVP